MERVSSFLTQYVLIGLIRLAKRRDSEVAHTNTQLIVISFLLFFCALIYIIKLLNYFHVDSNDRSLEDTVLWAWQASSSLESHLSIIAQMMSVCWLKIISTNSNITDRKRQKSVCVCICERTWTIAILCLNRKHTLHVTHVHGWQKKPAQYKSYSCFTIRFCIICKLKIQRMESFWLQYSMRKEIYTFSQLKPLNLHLKLRGNCRVFLVLRESRKTKW